jgi:WD40 repeat protein
MGNQPKKAVPGRRSIPRNVNVEDEPPSPILGDTNSLVDCSYLPYIHLEKTISTKKIVMAIATSTNGDYIAYGRNKIILLNGWDYSKIYQIRTKERGVLFSLVFSLGGTRLMSSTHKGHIQQWNVKTGALIQEIESLCGYVWCACLSPDGTRYITGGNNRTVRIRDSKSLALLLSLRGHTDLIRGVCCTPDSTKIITCSTDKSCRVWDYETGQCLNSMTFNDSICNTVTTNGSSIVIGLQKNSIILSDFSGNVIDRFVGHNMPVAFTGILSKALISGSDDGSIKIWDWDTRTLIETIGNFEFANEIHALSICPNRFIVTSYGKKCIKIWEFYTLEKLFQIHKRNKLHDISINFT